MGKQELANAYKAALAELAREHGIDAALMAAAVTLSHYHAGRCVGFTRGGEPLLFIPEALDENQNE